MKKYVRKAKEHDLPAIVNIIDAARKLLAERSIPQWQETTGPTKESLTLDLDKDRLFVLVVDEKVAGVAVITDEWDPAYEAMTTPWQEVDSTTYASIHRFAIAAAYRGQGLADWLMAQLIQLCELAGFKDIRIDTHPQNVAMQKVIEKAGFQKRGLVYLDVPNGERYAYQRVDKNKTSVEMGSKNEKQKK